MQAASEALARVTQANNAAAMAGGVPASSATRRRDHRARAFGAASTLQDRHADERRRVRRRACSAGGRGSPRLTALRATPLLDEIGRDLTALARDGMLAPSIGRDTETARLIEALVRPTRPSAVLLGPDGIGKETIVEGLAMRVVAGDVPGAAQGRARRRGPDLRARRRDPVPRPARGAPRPS